jgi:Purple acid Phosphatase, N-terminal domain/Calcineurin-like phosphoesterase
VETPYGEIPDRLVKDMRPQEMHDFLKRRYSRRSVLRGTGVLGVAAAAGPVFWRQSSAWASTSTTTTTPQWIAYGPDPTTSMFVSWSAGSASTPGSAPRPLVRWGLTKHYGRTQDAEGVTVPIPSPTYYTQPSGDVDDTVYLHTLLEGLEPNTTYHYSVSNDGGRSWFGDTTFSTGQRGYPDFRWVGTGDQSISDSSSLPNAQVLASFNPQFTVIAGDLSYASGGVLLPPREAGVVQGQPGYSPASWDQYFNIFGLNAAQSIPWLIGVGNHEMEPLADDGYAGVRARFPRHYDHTSGSPVTSTFTYGNVAFVQLDGNDLSAEISNNNNYTEGRQTAWLDRTLAHYRAPRSGVDFIVVSFHNCAFCSNTTHGSDGGIRTVWQPILDRHKVDLVLNGHVHAYERSYPVRGNTVASGVGGSGGTVYPEIHGTTYICAGNGGQSLYTDWYGPTGGGDPASASGPPLIWEWTGAPTPNGSDVSDNADSVTGFSAYRSAIWGFIVVDVKAPRYPGGETTLHIRAIDPSQPQPTSPPSGNDTGISSTSNPAVIDTITLSRRSAVHLR